MIQVFKSGKTISLIALHIILGIVFYTIPSLTKVYSIIIYLVGIPWVVISSNKQNQVLYVCAYIVGSEVLIRMTGGTLNHEFAKYSVILFMLLGVYFSGFSKSSFVYIIYAILLFPGIVISFYNLSFESNIRKAIMFNISGPITLVFSAMYCNQRKISFDELNKILLTLGFPIISTVTYLFLYTPTIKEVVIDTGSNFSTSGGFGPNQVSTILGLGAFIFFSKSFIGTSSKRLQLIFLLIGIFLSYRGIVTFSRGGMITSGVMLLIFVIVVYFKLKSSARIKMFGLVVVGVILVSAIWTYSSTQTDGLINKRYANQDAAGREKKDVLGGREQVSKVEINAFYKNPIFGIGVGKGKELREEELGKTVAAHSEITRTLAEHGVLGLFGLLILVLVPLSAYINNQQHFYMGAFLVFWALTINHAAMRIAATAFVYSLSLLKIYFDENSIYRE